MGTDMATASVRHTTAASLSREHPGLVRLGQAGWLAKGVVYVLAGVLAAVLLARALNVATGATAATGSEAEASPTGAINQIATFAGGRALLVAMGIGLLLYAVWRLLTAVLPGGTDAEALATRAGYLVSAVLYGTFGVSALRLASNPSRTEDGDQKARDITARTFGYPLGRWAVGLAGLITVGAGIYRIVKGYRGDVTDEVDLAGMSPARTRLTRRLAMAGEIGRGVAVGLIGVFITRAAVQFDPAEATGLDGALNRLAEVQWGRVVIGVIALGFVLYGIMCIESFRHRKLRTP